MKQLLTPLLAVLFAPACLFEAGVPADAHISCIASSECPDGYTCRAALRECRLASDVEEAAVEVKSPSVGPAAARAGVTLEAVFTTTRALALPPLVSLDTGEPLDVEALDDTATSFRATRLLDGTEPEGLHRVDATVVDEDGNEVTEPLGSTTLDFTKPDVDLARSSVAPTAVRPGGQVTVTLTLTEPLNGTATLTLGDADVVQVLELAGAVGVAVFAAPPDVAGSRAITISDLVDDAGNLADPVVLASELVIDNEPPLLTLDDLATDRFSAQPEHRDLVIAGDTESVVRLEATLGARELSCVQNSSRFSCSATIVDTDPEGPTTVLVRAVDEAGNASTAQRVVTIDLSPPRPIEASFTASYRAAPGSLVANPAGVAIGGSAVVTFALDEAPSGNVVVEGGGLALSAPQTAGAAVALIVSGDEGAASGLVDVVVTASDDVGNEATTVAGRVLALLTRPPPPPVLGPGAPTVDVDLNTFQITPRIAVPGGVVPAGFVLLARGPGDRILARLPTDDAPREVEVATADRPVRLLFLDAAGNASSEVTPEVVALVRPGGMRAVFGDVLQQAPIFFSQTPAFGVEPEEFVGRTSSTAVSRLAPPSVAPLLQQLAAPPDAVDGRGAVFDVPGNRFVWIEALGGSVTTFVSTGGEWTSLADVPLSPDRLAFGQGAGGAALLHGVDGTGTSRAFLLDGDAWTELPAVAGRKGGCLAVDVASGLPMLASPIDADGVLTGELWAFDGDAWILVDTNGAFADTCAAAGAPDGLHVTTNNFIEQVWDGTQWTFVDTFPQVFTSMAFDAAQQSLLAITDFGAGYAMVGGTWSDTGALGELPAGRAFIVPVDGRTVIVGQAPRLEAAGQMLIRARLIVGFTSVFIPTPTKMGVSVDVRALRSDDNLPRVQVIGTDGTVLVERPTFFGTLDVSDETPVEAFRVNDGAVEVLIAAPDAEAIELAVDSIRFRLRNVGFFYF